MSASISSQLQELCNSTEQKKSSAAHVAHLSSLLQEWIDTEHRPAGFGYLSSGERSALLLAAGKEKELDSALATFLLLDDHLQKFVLNARGLNRYAGQRIAID